MTFIKVTKKMIKEFEKDLKEIANIMLESNKIKNKRLYIRMNDFLVDEFMDMIRKLNHLKEFLEELKEEQKVAKRTKEVKK